MQSDGLYRFVTLRSNEISGREKPADPFVDAYGNSAPATRLFGDVSAALATSDFVTARSEAQQFVDALQLSANDPWELAKETPLRALTSQLAQLLRRGSDDDAVKLVASLSRSTTSTTGTHTHLTPTTAGGTLRSKLADLLLGQSLLPDLGMSFDATAQMILGLETIDRLNDRDSSGNPTARTFSWRIPLSLGRVFLPVQLGLPLPAPTSIRALAAHSRPHRGGSTLPTPHPARPRHWIGDLILMRQQVRGYVLGEIAHVENVLTGESFHRAFRTVTKTEQSLTTTTDTTRETERDLQSTTRDEIRSEIQKAKSDNLALSVNFNVQASYNGGTYSVVAGAGGSASYQRASEEREDTASDHAHEVVDKAVEHITERVQTVQESMSSYEEDDTSRHGIDNSKGTDHIIGVYRWLEKRVDLHLINYGRRLIYELMVPEPSTFWTRLVTERGNGQAGPPPVFPVLPPQAAGGQASKLSPDDFILRTQQGALDAPERWMEIQALAGDWGVALEYPPPVNKQVSLSFNVDGDKEKADPEQPLHSFGTGAASYFESPYVVSATPTEKLTVPDGYLASSGDLSLKAWMYVRAEKGGTHQYERGYAVLLLGGQEFGVASSDLSATGDHWQLDTSRILAQPLSGEVTVSVTSVFNGVAASISLNCDRTSDLEQQWALKMFALFADAYQAKLDAWNDAKARSALDSQTWAGNLPSATCRAIEKTELKRGVLEQFMLATLDQLGDTVLGDPTNTTYSPAEPTLTLSGVDGFTRDVTFFEEVFDWENVSYIFAPYMYGRRAEWANLAVGDDSDAQFKAFLSAGAARVQVPVRPGYEAHAEFFFRGLGRYPLDQRIPWLGGMHSIAEDLAAEAREGFVVGPGTISVTQDSTTVTGIGTIFKAPGDIARELRIGGKLYVIAAVSAPDEIELADPYADATAADMQYETGGIVVGPPIELSLPTTLVAIDKPGLTLPTYPPRYV